MTCAHVVDVALKKVAGVESVEVSLNKGLATVKLKPGRAGDVNRPIDSRLRWSASTLASIEAIVARCSSAGCSSARSRART